MKKVTGFTLGLELPPKLVKFETIGNALPESHKAALRSWDEEFVKPGAISKLIVQRSGTIVLMLSESQHQLP